MRGQEEILHSEGGEALEDVAQRGCGCSIPGGVQDQVTQGPIQSDLEHLQRWGIHSFSGKPVPVPHHPLSEEFPPNL